jgi:hypothetical protein
MTDNVIEFPTSYQPPQAAVPMPADSARSTIIELEHEVHELRMTVSDMALELYRCRQRLGEAT